MSYKYTYLFLDIVLFAIWLILFIRRKDTKKEMLFMSSITAFAGIPADVAYTRDWWRPIFIVPSIWFESAICAFMLGGIISIIYQEFFNKNIRHQHATNKPNPYRLLFIALAVAFIFLLSFFVFNLNSLIATILALGFPALYIYIKRSDLLVEGLITSILLLVVIVVSYNAVSLITPGWVKEFWLFKNTPQIILGGVPVDDFLWYIFAGLFIGPLYAYWQEGRFVKRPASN